MDLRRDQTFGVYEKNGGICSLKAIKYFLDITDFCMKKTVVQEFENVRDEAVEMVYKFADTDEETINFIQVELYDPEKDEIRVLKAKIEEKKKAQEKYDDAISDGSTAMLAEKDDDDDRVTLSLGNILPKVQVTVKMYSVEELKVEKSFTNPDDCRIRIKIPSLNYSGGQFTDTLDNIDVECRIKLTNSGKVWNIESTSHKEEFESEVEENSKSGITRTTKKLSFNRDIDLEITVKDAPLASCLIEQTGEEEDYVAAINIIPNFDDQEVEIQTEFVIIIDCSGSMGNDRMRYAKRAMEGFVDEIYNKSKIGSNHSIKLNVVRFGSGINCLYPDVPKLLDRTSYEQIKKYLEETTSNMGSTDILSPIRHVLQQKVSDGFTRQVFLLTDGEDHNTESIIKFVRNSAKTTRFFSYGIGKGINPVLIHRVADSSLGRAVFLDDDSEIEEKVKEQIVYALQPAIHDIEVKFQSASESVTKIIPACYNLQKRSLYYFLRGEICETCELSFRIGNKHVKKYTLPLTRSSNQFEKKGLFLGPIAARKQVRELETASSYSEELGMTKEIADQEIKRLGLTHHFLTSQTSFLMVNENEESIETELVTETIPNVQIKRGNNNQERGGEIFSGVTGDREYRLIKLRNAREKEREQRKQRLLTKKKEVLLSIRSRQMCSNDNGTTTTTTRRFVPNRGLSKFSRSRKNKLSVVLEKGSVLGRTGSSVDGFGNASLNKVVARGEHQWKLKYMICGPICEDDDTTEDDSSLPTFFGIYDPTKVKFEKIDPVNIGTEKIERSWALNVITGEIYHLGKVIKKVALPSEGGLKNGDIITIHVNLVEGTLSFKCNGEDIVGSKIEGIKGPLSPAVSIGNINVKVVVVNE